MLDASAQERLRGSQAANLIGQDIHEFGLGIRPAIGQAFLKMIPYAFIGVQFWGIRRKGHQMQTGRTGKKLLYRIAPMNLTIIQQDHQMASYLSQKLAEERRYLFAMEIVLIELAVQGTMETFRTDGNPRDRRDPVMIIPMKHNRCLSHRTPGLMDRGDQEETRFVDKDEVGCQPCGVFFTRGQTDRFHSAMAASLRSKARRSGFWWLQPIWCRSLPT